MSNTPENAPQQDPPPADAAAAPAQAAAPGALPPVVANIWNKFATRELAKGRRDIGHLVEVTLQFVMDQNSKNLAPMVNTLEQLRRWLISIDKELQSMQRALVENPKATMDAPYQRQSIVLDKNGKNGPTVVISPTGTPTQARAELQSYVATMQKQRELVNQAITEQTNALQARRDHLAHTLRQYSAELQRSAAEMLANAPPIPEAPKKTRKTAEDLLPAATKAKPAPRPRTGNLALRFKLWLASFNPVTMVRAWGQALMRGYRADPFELPEALDDMPVVPAVDPKAPKKPKVFTI